MVTVKKLFKSIADNRSAIVKNAFIVAAGVSGGAILTSLLFKGSDDIDDVKVADTEVLNSEDSTGVNGE